ncbi:MAG: tetratricopeptide (TPR) repeat protein, partial [Candidatus Promineifilaceae bacterium]
TSVLFGFLSLFVLLGIIEIYASLPIYWQQWQLTGQWPSIRRLVAGSGSPNIAGIMFTIGILLSSHKIIHAPHNRQGRLFAFLALLVLTPFLLVTQSAGAFLALFAGLLVSALIVVKPKLVDLVKSLGKGISISIGLFLLIISIFSIFYSWPYLVQDSGLRDRLQIWEAGLYTWQQHKLLGSGLNTFSSFFNARYAPQVIFQATHNWWLNILAEAGIIGGIASLVLWGQLGKLLYEHRHTKEWDPLTKALFASLVAFVVHSLIDTPETWTMGLGACLLAMFYVSLVPYPVQPSRFPIKLIVWPILSIVLVVVGAFNYAYRVQYDVAIELGNDEDWLAAATQFDTLLESSFIEDSSALYGSAFSHGMLAADSVTDREIAIEQYQKLILLEHSWAANHANLGWLYQLQGSDSAALQAYSQAAILRPKQPLFAFNGVLLAETTSQPLLEQDQINYENVYDTASVWHSAPFWQLTPDRQKVVAQASSRECLNPQNTTCSTYKEQELTAAWESLAGGDFDQAYEQFITFESAGHPVQDSSVYLGLHLSKQNRHPFVPPPSSAPNFSTIDLNYYRLWENVLGLNQDELATELKFFLYQSATGFGRSGFDSYAKFIFSRSSLHFDLLPGLICFTVDDNLDWQLTQLEAWYRANDRIDLAEVVQDAHFGPQSDGLHPCLARATNDE